MTDSTNTTTGTLGPGSKPPDPKFSEATKQGNDLQATDTEEDETSVELNAEVVK